MRIDDFVCLGRTVPEASAKYGVKVCMAGYSAELRSFVRVYPLEIRNPIHARSRCVLEVERNPADSRIESWKLSARNDSVLEVCGQVPTAEVIRFLRTHLSCSIDELNARRASLGVLEVNGEAQGIFRSRKEVDAPGQQTLFDVADADSRFGHRPLAIAPYLEFFDGAGKFHALQLREWGAYEWLRTEPAKATQLWENLHINDGQRTILVVGNMTNHRNVWLVIKTFKCEREQKTGLFNQLETVPA